MAISEVPQKKEESFDKLNVGEETKLIISLLNEYSEKLVKVCEQSEQITISWNYRFESVLNTALFIIVLNLIVFLLTKDFPKFDNILVFFTSFVINYIFSQINKSQRQANILKNSRRIANRLETIIRIASQFNEQVTSNFVSRIEFDFRLTDAEDVLERYRYLSEKYRKSIKIFN